MNEKYSNNQKCWLFDIFQKLRGGGEGNPCQEQGYFLHTILLSPTKR